MTRPILSFLTRLSNGLVWLAGLILALFTLRRWLFLLAILRRQPERQPPPLNGRPPALLLVPFYNEAAALPGLLACLERLDYPADALIIVLVDDGSTDEGGRIAREWAAGVANRHYFPLPGNVGKAAALNAALARFPQGALAAVYDADERPSPDVLSWLLPYFADERVGAVNGRRAVNNPLASPIASHAAIENAVHQLVTMPAKERLNLAPALLGSNCVYRRAALAEVGGFLPGALLEDSDLTLKLARAGWRVHFAPEAVSCHAAPETLAGYWRQHTRWMAGFGAVTRQQAAVTLCARHLPWRLRLELLAFSLGYLDRAALLAVGWKTAVSRRRSPFLLTVLLTSLITPLFQVIVALRQSHAPAALWRGIFGLPFFLPLEMGVALVGLVRRRLGG